MAHTKQQIKRYKNDYKKHAKNVSYKSALKTQIKKVLEAVDSNDKETAEKEFSLCTKMLDSSVSKGIHKKNYASNQKSRLQKKINALG